MGMQPAIIQVRLGNFFRFTTPQGLCMCNKKSSPPFTGATLFLFPRFGSLPDVHAGLLAVVKEGRPAFVAGVVRLQPAARQIAASHFHHSNIRLFQLK